MDLHIAQAADRLLPVCEDDERHEVRIAREILALTDLERIHELASELLRMHQRPAPLVALAPSSWADPEPAATSWRS